jgi:phytol kinase
MSDVLGASGLLLLFLAVTAVAELLTRKGHLAAETARKSIHLAGGLGCLLFPLLITSWVTVLGLAILLAGVFHLGEHHAMLKSLSSVERKSHGALLFPLAILLLFIPADGRLWLYISSLLVLVLADAAAALAGTRFGRVFYETAPGEQKSLEGTTVFCLVGFLAVYLPLLLLHDIPHASCLLTALLMALLLGGLEAVSISGTDNLFVPLATCFLLIKLTTKPQTEILFQCVSFIALTAGLIVANHRHKTLQVRTLILFILVAYAAWSLGSVDWMLPVIAGFVLYNRICKRCAPLAPLTARELLRPLYPSLAILLTANATLAFEFWFAPFLVATATACSLCAVNRFRREATPRPLRGTQLAYAALLPAAIPCLLLLPTQGGSALVAAPIAIALCASTTLIYNRSGKTPITPFCWHYAIPLYAGATALIHVGLQLTGWFPTMRPSTWMELFR